MIVGNVEPVINLFVDVMIMIADFFGGFILLFGFDLCLY